MAGPNKKMTAMSSSYLPRAQPQQQANIWGSTPRERLIGVVVVTLLCASPAPMIYAVRHYRFLDDRTFEVWVVAVLVAFALSFLLVRGRVFPAFVPVGGRVAARAGWSLGFVCLCIGLIGIANGALDSDVEVREVICVAKRAPAGEQGSGFYLDVRPWRGTDRTVALSVPRWMFREVAAGSNIRLTLGTGALGLEWVKKIEPVGRTPR